MRQLSALDAQFLAVETNTEIANLGCVAVLDGELARADLVHLVRRCAAPVALLRQRMMPVPFGLDRSYWVDDDAVDLRYHIRQIRLQGPGSDQQLAARVARLHGRRLDRRRPLWQMYLVQGLSGRRSAVYVKLHHAAVDGVAGTEVLAALLDQKTPTDLRPAGLPAAPGRIPGRSAVLARAMGRLAASPVRLARCVFQTVPYLDEIPVASQLPGAGQVSGTVRSVICRLSGRAPLPALPPLPVPRTVFTGPGSGRRTFACANLPLDEVQRFKDTFGVTVNDVVMAVTAAAVRRWLLDRGALPQGPLVAGVPFSLREPGDSRPGNQVTLMLAPLPTHIADPRERLQAVHTAMLPIKDRRRRSRADWLQQVSDVVPPVLTGPVDRAVFSLIARTCPVSNLVVSNVPGPQQLLTLCGRRVVAVYPVPPLAAATGNLNVTAFSYHGMITLGVIADAAVIADAWQIADRLAEAWQELHSLTA